MSVTKITTVALVLGFLLTGESSAYDGLVFYGARLSSQDFINSKGEPLLTLGAVLQQDRANVHRFGRKDPEDEIDIYFTTRQRRALFQRAAIRIDPSLRDEILAGKTVAVTVYVFTKNEVEVKPGLPPMDYP